MSWEMPRLWVTCVVLVCTLGLGVAAIALGEDLRKVFAGETVSPLDEVQLAAVEPTHETSRGLTSGSVLPASEVPSVTTTLPREKPALVSAPDLAQADRVIDHEQAYRQAAKVALAVELARVTLRNQLTAHIAEVEQSAANAIAVAQAEAVAEEAAAESARVAQADVVAEEGVQAEEPIVTAALTLEDVPLPTKRPKTVPRSQDVALSYAPAPEAQDDDGGLFGGLNKVFSKNGKVTMPGRNSKVAVYEISTATVHMPDGTKLEAHSGMGKMKDNPKYVYKKNRGPTPPNIYTLRMRERRFHGVEAIRMLPQDVAAMRGRDGMLTHTALVRGTNGSHGCVAFKNYNKFLNAFKAGKVTKMIVVPHLDELPTYMASL